MGSNEKPERGLDEQLAPSRDSRRVARWQPRGPWRRLATHSDAAWCGTVWRRLASHGNVGRSCRAGGAWQLVWRVATLATHGNAGNGWRLVSRVATVAASSSK